MIITLRAHRTWMLALALLAAATMSCNKDGGGGDGGGGGSPTQTDPDPIDPCFGLQDDEEEASDDGELDAPADVTDTDAGATDESTDLEDTDTTGDDGSTDISSGGSSDCGDPFPSDDGATAPSDDGGASSGGGTTEGPPYDECVSQGKAWIPVSKNGAYCGDDLVSWCCNEATIMAKFSAHKDLQTDISTVTGDGLKLYHCSKSADEKVSFHFAIKEDGKTRYKHVWVKGGEVEADAPAECPIVTAADMGFLDDEEEEEEEEEDAGEDESDVEITDDVVDDDDEEEDDEVDGASSI